MRAIQIVKTTLGSAALVAGLTLTTTPAEAKHKHHGGHRHDHACQHHDDEHYDDDRGYHGRYDDHDRDHDDYDRPRYRHARRIVVPHEIVFEEVGQYRPYYERRAYYAPHRHHHVLYSFPVHTARGIVHRQHAYCRGPRGFVAFQGPRFGLHVDF